MESIKHIIALLCTKCLFFPFISTGGENKTKNKNLVIFLLFFHKQTKTQNSRITFSVAILFPETILKLYAVFPRTWRNGQLTTD